jgi:Regulator of chromosome condensation (RCC1) repeat/Bacterial Ig-like domain (group 2)
MLTSRSFIHGFPALLVLSALACGGGDSATSPNPPPVGRETVTVTADVEPRGPGVTRDLPIGMSFHVSAVVKDPAGTVLPDRTVSWSSNSPNVAAVDASGVVTGLAQGNAVITATSQGTTGSLSITVRPLFGRAAPGPVAGAHTFASISANGVVTCGLDGAGLSYCWGPGKATPTALGGGLAFASLASGGSLEGAHLCALDSGGKAYCWGDNGLGQLGDGSRLQSDTPVAVTGGFTFTSLAAGQSHSCGLISSGAAYCWGTTNLKSSLTPAAVSGGLSFVALGAGDDHTCGLTAAGSAYCWGENDNGELGDGSGQNQLSPVAVSGGLVFTTLAVGGEHVCALTSAGAVYCWGWHNIGGYSISNRDRHTPVLVSGDLAFTSLAAGGAHDCALTAAGAAYCWGEDFFGQLGDALAFDRLALAPVVGGLSFSALTAGGYQTCGLVASGIAYCWGHNENGELGDGPP